MHRGSNNDSPGRWRRDSMEQFLSYLKAWDIKREREREREREKKREKITPTKWRLIYNPGNTGALQFEMQLYRPQEMLISQRGF